MTCNIQLNSLTCYKAFTLLLIMYLVFLTTFALLFDLLLFLQLLCDAGFTQRLTFAALVGLGIERRFQSCVTPHANHHLLTQLQAQNNNNPQHCFMVH